MRPEVFTAFADEVVRCTPITMPCVCLSWNIMHLMLVDPMRKLLEQTIESLQGIHSDDLFTPKLVTTRIKSHSRGLTTKNVFFLMINFLMIIFLSSVR